MTQASIVIPTFNHARLFSRAIDSALIQTVPCEVVVCDQVRSITIQAGATGKRNALIDAYEVARGYYLRWPKSIPKPRMVLGLYSFLKWWLRCGLLNHLKSGVFFIVRRIYFLQDRNKSRVSTL